MKEKHSYRNFICISESLSSTVISVTGPLPPPTLTLCVLQAGISCLQLGDPLDARGSNSPSFLFFRFCEVASPLLVGAIRGQRSSCNLQLRLHGFCSYRGLAGKSACSFWHLFWLELIVTATFLKELMLRCSRCRSLKRLLLCCLLGHRGIRCHQKRLCWAVACDILDTNNATAITNRNNSNNNQSNSTFRWKIHVFSAARDLRIYCLGDEWGEV